MKSITSHLTFRITVSITLIGLGLSFFLYSAVRNTAAEFYSSTIQEDMKWVSRAAVSMLSNELDKLIKSGHAEDPKFINIYQNRAILEIEYFLRDYTAYGIIRHEGDDSAIFFPAELPASPQEIIASIPADNSVTPLRFKTGLHYGYSVRFAPWGWRFFLVRPAASYAAFQSRLEGVYLATGVALALAILVIVYLIYSSVNLPINRIISSLRGGKKPDYKGVFEPEYLSDSIRSMMESLESLNRNLEDKVKELISQGEARKRLEEQLLQSQKMEAIGLLAGGVAHDFNNILTAITGYGSLLLKKLKPGDPLRRYAEDLLAASGKAASLTKSLLAFGRKQVLLIKPVNLDEVIKNVGNLLTRLIREDIEFKMIESKEDLIVMADSGQIEQVLINLAANARDAMPDGGTLTIRTERIYLSSPASYLPPGAYALITISDTGVGMDEATKQRIFEPFFTTKDQGKGTGLGLSIVYGIVKQHNGEISVYSEPGQGTIFRIYLKLVDSKVEHEESAGVIPLIGGNETILLAEDNPDVRKLLITILEEYGYTVIVAVDGEDAVAKYIENQGRIQLLLLDVVMPKKNGPEAYEEIRRIQAGDVPVLFTSGYPADIIHNKGLLETGAYLIAKPVSPQLLLSKVREVLAR